MLRRSRGFERRFAKRDDGATPGGLAGMRTPSRAGGRVVGDPLAQPFSMGRNLFCVHSKKYIDIEEDADHVADL